MGKLGLTELFVIFICIALYFLPAFIASNRRAADRTGIFLLNLLAGWTFVGWVASLIWACTGKKEIDPMLFYTHNSYSNPVANSEIKDEDFSMKLDKIQKLKDLLDSGAITQEEFDSQKARLLL